MKFILIMILLLFSCSFAQKIKLNYDEINIFGNDVTTQKTILDIISEKQMKYLSVETIKRRLEASNLFRKVNLILSNKKLSIFLTEKKYFKILPFASLYNDLWEWKYISAGFILNYDNLFGRNYSLSLTSVYGYTEHYELKVKRLRFKGVNLSSGIGYKNEHHKSVKDSAFNKDYRSYFSNELERKINDYNSIFFELNLSYDNILTKKYLYPVLGVGYKFNSLDLLALPRRGNFFKTEILNSGLGNYNLDFWNFNNVYRIYYSLIKKNKLNASFLAKQRIVLGNKLPNYYKIYLGYEEKLRGFQDYKGIGKDFYKFGFYLRNKTFTLRNVYPNFFIGRNRNKVDLYTEVFAEIISMSDDIFSTKRENIISAGLSFYAKTPFLIFPIRLDIALLSKKDILFKNISYTISIDAFDF